MNRMLLFHPFKSRSSRFGMKFTYLLLFAVSCWILGLQFSCARYNPYGKGTSDGRIIVDELNTSAEKPIPLCGMAELPIIAQKLYCANGQRFHTSIEDGLEKKTEDVTVKSKNGHDIFRFDGYCHDKLIVLYVAPDACEEATEYQPYSSDDIDEIE